MIPPFDAQMSPAEKVAFNGQRAASLVTLATVTPEPVDWLWRDRLALGKVVVFDGDPSLGKSTVTVDWAARVSTGTPWPDGSACPIGDVLVLSAEDGLADTIRPRLDAAGGDPARVHALTGVTFLDDDGQRRERAITLADIDVIAEAVQAHDVTLVIVDVLMAYLPTGTDAYRDQDVRTVLARLAKLAEETGCCIVLVRHLNKSAGGNPLYRGGGSIGIVGAARAAFVAGVDPEDESRRVLACTKSNLAVMPPSLAFRLVSAPNGVARVEWCGTSNASAASLLAVREGEDERTERDAAVEWLLDYLSESNGEAPAGQIIKAASEVGIAKVTLHRARKRAGVSTHKGGLKTGWTWQIEAGRFHEGSEGSTSWEVESTEPSVKPSTPLRRPCEVCGEPMLVIEVGQTRHPNCGGEL